MQATAADGRGDALLDVRPDVALEERTVQLLLVGLQPTHLLDRLARLARLDLLFYAAAALPQSLWDRLERLGLETRGSKVPFISSWGLTETAPAVTMVHFPMDRPGNIGVPGPGMQVKLAPEGDKLEIRVKGPNVTPGYFKAPDLSAKAATRRPMPSGTARSVSSWFTLYRA